MDDESRKILKRVFNSFTNNQNLMQFSQFSYFCEKYKFISNSFNLNDISNIYSNIRSAKRKEITLDEFIEALNAISVKKGKDVINIILSKFRKPKKPEKKEREIKKEIDLKKEINESKLNEVLQRQEKIRTNNFNSSINESKVKML